MKRYPLWFFWVCFLGLMPVSAADYYWVGGSGNWSDINRWATTSGGSLKHIVVPSPNDNVIFDHNSFASPGQTVTIDPSIATARDFRILNVQNMPSFMGSGQIRIYGSLRLSRQADWAHTGNIYFEGVTTGHTITTDSITLPRSIYFQGIGGGWTLLDDLNCFESVYLHYGSLNTNGKGVIVNSLLSPQSNQRSLTLGNSELFIRGQINLALQNLQFNAGQSNIIFGPNGALNTSGAGTAVFHTVSFLGSGSITGNNNYHTLRFTAGFNYNISSISTITHLFEAIGTCVKQIGIQGVWHLTMPAGSQFLAEYTRIRDLTAFGGATFNANESIDLGGNSGINFIPLTPFDLYWVGGSGQWNDTAHWSYVSGGPGGACIPRPIDNVWFDANSFSPNDSVEIAGQDADCLNMRWVNIPTGIILNKMMDLHIHGSLWLHHNLTWAGGSSITWFVSDQTGETITSDNVVLTGPVYFDGGGSWTLTDDFHISEHGVEHVEGTWNTNGKTVRVFSYHSAYQNTRALILDSTRFIVSSFMPQAWQLNGTSFTLNAGTSTVDFITPDGGMRNTSSNGVTFHHVIFSSPEGHSKLETDANNFHTLTFNSNGIIRGNNTIGTLNFTKGKDYSLAPTTMQIILDHLNSIGGCDGYILLHTEEKDFSASLLKSSGTVTCDYMIIWDIHATGGAIFNATNSVDIGGNLGWNFTSPTPKSLYWVGGTGEWSDVTHWSYTSGGPGGACVPSPLDSVFFDDNSFIKAFDTVIVDLTNATCHTMTWSHSLYDALMTGPDYNTLWFWGSMIMNTKMNSEFLGAARFEAADTGHVITMANNWFYHFVTFNGRGGSWYVTDSLNCELVVMLRHGNLLAGGKLIQAGALRSTDASSRMLDITQTEVRITGSAQAWDLVHDSLVLMAAGSELLFLSAGMVDFINRGTIPDTVNYHNISFSNEKSSAVMHSIDIYAVINVALLEGGGRFLASFRYDSLLLTGGNNYSFEGGTTQTFNYLRAEGSCFFPISFILSGSASPNYFFHNLSPAASVSHVSMQGCHGVPPSTYTAAGSTNNGGNNNWVITPVGPVDLFWVNGTGSWQDSSHWSYTSGGPGGACIPTWRDNVFFDQNSFITSQDTVNIPNAASECRDMRWVNISSTPAFFQNGFPIHIFGSMVLDAAMIGAFNGQIHFLATDTGHVINPAGQVFQDAVNFTGNGGGWTLQDSLTVLQVIQHTRGRLNTNSHTVKSRAYLSTANNPRQLLLGNTTFTVNNLWRINGTNMLFNSGQSHIILTANNAQMISENGQGFMYHNVSFLGTNNLNTLRCNNIPVSYNKVLLSNNTDIYGEHTFDSLLMMPGNLYQLEKGKTQKILSYWLLRGNNCFPLTLQSTQLGQQATVEKTTGTVAGDFLHMRDIAATGGATFFAGDNSSDIANNTGWNFSNSPGYIFGLGPDIEFTIGTSVTLSTANFNAGPGTTYLWSTGATTPSIIVNQPDTYYVTVTYASNCVVVDSIIVFCNVKPHYTIGDCICYGDNTGWITMTIQDTVGVYTAMWSHGANQLNVSNLTAGQYFVNIYGSTGCNGRDTLWVGQPPPVIVPLNDTSFCEDDTGVLLDATSQFVNFWWNGQQGGQTLFVNQATTVVVMVEDADGCFSDPDTIRVTIDTIPIIFLGEDAEICLGDQIVLTPGPGFDSYLWHDGSTGETFTATQGGVYYVTIKARTCVTHDTIVLFDCPPVLTFPNVFTPNGDGYNDYFYPIHQNVYQYELVVFDRWGTVVFTTKDVYARWDGTTRGQPCPEGVYFYTVDYTGFGQKAIPGKKFHNGSVTILR
jgi:gliding motility-associated-like protein